MTYVQAHTDRQPTPNRRVWLLTLLAGVHVSPPKSHTSHVTVEQEVECVVWWHKTGHYVFFWKSSLKRGRFKVCVSLWVVPFFNVFSKYCFLYNKATKPVTLSHLKHNNSWHSCLKSQSVLCSWFLLSSPFFSAHAPCTSIFLSFFPTHPPQYSLWDHPSYPAECLVRACMIMCVHVCDGRLHRDKREAPSLH